MRTVILISGLAVLLALPVAAQQHGMAPNVCTPDPSCPRVDPEPAICALFSGMLSFETAEGLIQRRVVMQDWQIPNELTVEIPHQGFLIVQLRAGTLTTKIGDKQQEWPVGSFWTVRADQRLIVSTARDSVVLQTLDFAPK